jgi:cytochrome c oxidase cbb3-type subunit IV
VDLSDLRTIVTTLSFIAFLGVVFWAYNGKQKKRFDEAANLPFVDADEGLSAQRASGDRHE